jgi:hypothetical protein
VSDNPSARRVERVASSSCAPEIFEQLPAVDSLELAQLRQARRHGQRIAGKRPRLIHGSVGRELIHDLRASAERAHWQPAADHFAKRRQVGRDVVQLLCTAARDAEAGHHFVEDQERAFGGCIHHAGMEEASPEDTGQRRRHGSTMFAATSPVFSRNAARTATCHCTAGEIVSARTLRGYLAIRADRA